MKIPNTIIIVTTLKPDYSIDLIKKKNSENIKIS